MKLHVYSFIILIHHLESVGSVAIHETIAIWNSPVTKQERNLMCCFRPKRNEIPKHVRVLPYQEVG